MKDENAQALLAKVMGWDSDDRLYDNAAMTGWDTGWPDAQVRIAPETGR